MMKKISNLPPKGTYDWMPNEFAIRKYIFDIWRKVCVSFGYKEYLTPILENAEIYRAKSGEDVGGNELLTIKKEDEELAIRPEMTPSVTRMVTKIYETTPKPLRLFSIANFYRYQKPQKGRNREFWQLNCDLFGSESISSDIEIIIISIELMLAFGATSSQFIVYLNDRKLIESLLSGYLNIKPENFKIATRILDKFGKITITELADRLVKEAGGTVIDKNELEGFLNLDPNITEKFTNKYLVNNSGLQRLKETIRILTELGYGDYLLFNPSMIRGFDYYDGIIFEVFDRKSTTKEGVRRSLFGGGRYNGLAAIFGEKSFPAVGFAPGDETMKLFLESYNLLPDFSLSNSAEYYLPLLDSKFIKEQNSIAARLRRDNKIVTTGLEVQSIGKALDTANKINSGFTVIFGETEKAKGVITVKDMKSGEQNEIEFKF